MKRVLLINTNTETRPYPVPPMGLCLVANSICNKYEVKVYDGTFQKNNGLPECISEFKPDYIGFSMRNIDDMVWENCTYYVDKVYQDFIEPVKAVTKVPLIMGGSGFSVFPNAIMQSFGMDFGIVGAGEDVLGSLLDALDRGTDVIRIPGVITKDFDVSQLNPSAGKKTEYYQPHSTLEKWIDFEPYRLQGTYSIQTKRGCSFQCLYCTYPQIEGCGYQLRNAKDIVDEIASAIDKVGNVTFEFVDSVFNDPPGHAEAICSEIIRRGLKIRIRAMGINPAKFSRELVELMIGAGFRQIDSTPDSASPEIIRNLRKNFTIPQLKQTADIIKEFNLPTMWFFIFGGPGENLKTIDETFDFIDQYVNPADMVHLTAGLRIYPHTGLAAVAESEGVISKDESLLVPKFYHTGDLSSEQLKSVLKEKCASRTNCILSSESSPSAEMLKLAITMRQEQHLDEPMFRTLLRIRNSKI